MPYGKIKEDTMILLKSPILTVMYKLLIFFVLLFFAVVLVKHIGRAVERKDK